MERAQGQYGSIIVKWDMTPGTGVDLTPVSGTITFGDRQDKGFIHLASVADTVSQDLQVQTVNDNVSLICDIIVCCHGDSQHAECIIRSTVTFLAHLRILLFSEIPNLFNHKKEN